MAESQTPFVYDPATLAALENNLSIPRLNRYRRRANFNSALTIEFYLFNARLAKALLFLLHIAEIALRNHVHAVFSRLYRPAWHTHPAFAAALSPKGQRILAEMLARQPNAATDDFVAKASFEFWASFFRATYAQTLRAQLHQALPHNINPISAHDFQVLVTDINTMRNRVAHHEPVFHLNIFKAAGQMRDLVATIDPAVARWMSAHSTLNAMSATRPTVGGYGNLVAADADPMVLQGGPDTPLTTVTAHLSAGGAGFICRDATGQISCVLNSTHVLNFIQAKALAQGSMVCLEDHSVADVIAGLGANFVEVDAASRTRFLSAQFQTKTDTAVVTSRRNGVATVTGIIHRAHRRY